MDADQLTNESILRAYERVDWATTAVGPRETWSPARRRAHILVVETRFAATLFWGPKQVLLYNEAYVPLIAEKHPGALGAPARECSPRRGPRSAR